MIELACRDVAFHGQAPTDVRATQSGPRRATSPRLTPHDRLGCNVSNSAPVNASPSVAKSPGRRYIPGILPRSCSSGGCYGAQLVVPLASDFDPDTQCGCRPDDAQRPA